MATDYKKLTGDLIRAKGVAEIESLGEDSGSINLDTMTIELPYAITQKVVMAVKEAGLITYGPRLWRGKRYFINPPKCGQSTSRQRSVQAMYKVMREAGWEVLICKQADN